MSQTQTCPHCGHTPKNNLSDKFTVVDITPEHYEYDEEKLIAKIKEQVLTEVRQSVEPLLIKLKEIGEQQSAANQTGNANPQQTHDQQLQKIQAQAMERMKAKEQSLAMRMKKLQLRTSRLST